MIMRTFCCATYKKCSMMKVRLTIQDGSSLLVQTLGICFNVRLMIIFVKRKKLYDYEDFYSAVYAYLCTKSFYVAVFVATNVLQRSINLPFHKFSTLILFMIIGICFF